MDKAAVTAPQLQDHFNARELRDAFGMFPTGVAVVTTLDAAGVPVGLTISSFSSVSLHPPLILWSLVNTAGSRDAFLNNRHFAINVLAAEQLPLAHRFASRSVDRFHQVPVEVGLSGVPLLSGALAWFECTRFAEHPAGDHTIFIGRVERVGHRPVVEGISTDGTTGTDPQPVGTFAPLVFHRGILHDGGLTP